MDDSTPPVEHILRPHHIAILTIFALGFQDNVYKRFPVPFTLHLYRLLLNEVSEVAYPKGYQELMEELSSGPRADAEECRAFIQRIYAMREELQSPEMLANFFASQTSLFLEKSEDTRRSIFGYFCRRCFVTFLKLSFTSVIKLQKDYQTWTRGDSQAGYEVIKKEPLIHAESLIFKTQADKHPWAKSHALDASEKGQAIGDEYVASENLRRFFEQHFHEANDSGLRQHALLNLARTHYIRGEQLAARKLLSEAVSVARTSGDRITLQHCIRQAETNRCHFASLFNRLPPEIPGQKPVLNDVQPDLHPHEVLFDVQKLLDEHNDQPLGAAFARIVQAVSLFDHLLDVQLSTPTEEEQWAQHAVQSIVWSLSGCEKLAAVEENIVIAFTNMNSDDNTRLTVLLNKAYKAATLYTPSAYKARQGQYDKGLSILLEPSAWRGLALHDYTLWAHEIWHILVLRATRRGQYRLYREYLLPRQPQGLFNPRQYVFDVSGIELSKVTQPLYDVLQMRKHGQATTVIEQILKALWNAEFLGRMDEYRTGIILLADVGLEYGLSKRSRQILDEIMPQIMLGENLEQRALACFIMARCILLAEESIPSTFQLALSYLSAAESDFMQLEMFRSLTDVQYLTSVIYHNLGMEKERDEVIARHDSSRVEQRRLEAIVVDKDTQRVLELVINVGAALARR
ncbi:hypothetical protein BDQ12DRAFT_597893 [Crucibulum laeve]|uniref:Anaphase-promoting complex subunit 5 n=1 Tax=Crucibulum laeve TaxID=68775 RepID=A0A5C3MAY9_9AGAR|nr:hypothetical protein BDQ12DRAFT_597893 [Crucibulum laeve]